MKNIIAIIALAVSLGGCIIYKSRPTYDAYFIPTPVPPATPVTIYVPVSPPMYYIVPPAPRVGPPGMRPRAPGRRPGMPRR